MVGKIYVLGAGVSGLAVGYELAKKGCEVEILEKESATGGLAKTIHWKNRAVDMGPHIYHTPDEDIRSYWLDEFGELLHERDHWAKNLKNGQYYDYPISREFINSLPPDVRDKIQEELDSTSSTELASASNYYEYTRALAGPTLQELFFTKYPEKLWGMSTKELDANWAPKRIQITEKRKAFYEGQWSAVGAEGSGSVIARLKNKFEHAGGALNCNEEVISITTGNVGNISELSTSNRTVRLNPNDIVINTLSCSVFSELLGIKTDLRYRGVILVLLHVSKTDVLPEGVDFFYVDAEDILFNRVSDQNSFVKSPVLDSTVLCFEVTYSDNDENDVRAIEELVDIIKRNVQALNLCEPEEILDAKVIKLPEVYPMYFLGYQLALNATREKFDRIPNLYTIGSLAEFAYADLQILFSKAIDMAELITDKTFRVNRIVKTTPRMKFDREVKIRGRSIGYGHPAYIIAEIGLNHNGDLDLAKKLIDEAIFSGADAVKLQSFKSEIRVAKHGKTSRYAEKVLGTEETDYEMLKKCELSYEDTKDLFEYARGRTTIFSAPFDLQSAEELEALDVDCYKVASFDLVNLPLIRKIARTGKPIIMSTGMSYLSEVEEALLEISKQSGSQVILMQCTSSYPCPPESMNIRAMDTMKSAFGGLPVGISDHVIGDAVSLAAVALGANIVEKHFTLNKRLEGPDHVLSLTPEELREMCDRIRVVEASLGDGVKQPAANEIASIVRFRKTMYARRKIETGEIIREEDITYMGPAYGIYAKFEDLVVGRRASRDIDAQTPITWDALV